jgi:hypothetical protein
MFSFHFRNVSVNWGEKYPSISMQRLETIWRRGAKMMDNLRREHGRVLVLAEREGQAIASITFELIGMGKKLPLT